MAKSKNHTNHNQNRKDHKNGIKRPKRFACESTKGMNQKFLRNLRYARKHNLSKTKLEKLRVNKAKIAARIAAKATESKA